MRTVDPGRNGNHAPTSFPACVDVDAWEEAYDQANSWPPPRSPLLARLVWLFFWAGGLALVGLWVVGLAVVVQALADLLLP